MTKSLIHELRFETLEWISTPPNATCREPFRIVMRADPADHIQTLARNKVEFSEIGWRVMDPLKAWMEECL